MKVLEVSNFIGHENRFILHGVKITMAIYRMTWTLVMFLELDNVNTAVFVLIVIRMLTSPAGEASWDASEICRLPRGIDLFEENHLNALTPLKL